MTYHDITRENSNRQSSVRVRGVLVRP